MRQVRVTSRGRPQTEPGYGTEPVEDHSRMLVPFEPTNTEAAEEEQFNAYMARYWPGLPPCRVAG